MTYKGWYAIKPNQPTNQPRYTRVSQKFCIIFVTWGNIWLIWMLCRGHESEKPNYKMPSSPDTLRVLFTGFASMVWGTASESTVTVIYITGSIVWLSNHPHSETMQNVQAHQLPRFYQSQWVPSMTWTVSVMWYICRKLARTTKISQNFWFTV